jgi:anti-sigma-K factor RskA
MLAAHALGALDSDEARRVEEHLSSCAECRAEMQEWQATASALAYTAEPAEPSLELRSKILEAVREDGSAAPKVSKEIQEQAPPSNVVEMPRRSRRSRVQTFLAIAAAVAILALAAALFVTWQRLNETRRELARNQTAVEALAKQVEQERGVRELLTSPQSQNAQLAGTNMAPNARAQLVFDRRTGHAMLFAYNLPPVPAGKAYQLWFISGGKVMPGRVFTPDTNGRAMINEEVPVNNLDTAPVFAVTLEPSGGVQVATGEKYLLSASS